MLTVKLVSIHYAAPEVNIYTFRATDGATLPPAPGGAHFDLHVAPGMIRQYSLVNEGDEPELYQIAVKQLNDGRGGSRKWHVESLVGQNYTISAPRSLFPGEAPSGRQEILLAGGIGITPMLSLWRARKRARQATQLYYWGPDRARMAFYRELSEQEGVTLLETTQGTPARVSEIIHKHRDDAVFYACGPERMIAEAEQAAATAGATLFVERFAPAIASAAAAPAASTTGFTVRLVQSGIDLDVRPSETILDACLRHNIDVAFSCEQGVCGACEVRVISGNVDHRDALYHSDGPREMMMICCSMPADDGMLELDL